MISIMGSILLGVGLVVGISLVIVVFEELGEQIMENLHQRRNK